MKKDIVHIYYGSQGSGGLYIHEIYSSLKKEGLNQEVFLSYYYPFKYGKKIFFKYSDLASGVKKSKGRLYLRGLELVYGLFHTLFYIIIHQPKIVNYSLISSYISDVIFLNLIKITSNSKIIITCHDVIPFGETEDSVIKQISTRNKIFELADYFIVHNSNSISDLEKIFKISTDKIFFHPFPLMDLHKIVKRKDFSLKKQYDFSFFGHFRESKGIDVLIDAWKLFHKKYPKAQLLLAGNLPDGSKLDLSGFDGLNINLHLRYLSDDDYFDFVNSSRNVILPYRSGTNSGVVYNLITMGVNILYSDLPMFTSNPLLDKSSQFKANDIYSLFEKMCEYYHIDMVKIKPKIEEYETNFSQCVCGTYKKILKN